MIQTWKQKSHVKFHTSKLEILGMPSPQPKSRKPLHTSACHKSKIKGQIAVTIIIHTLKG